MGCRPGTERDRFTPSAYRPTHEASPISGAIGGVVSASILESPINCGEELGYPELPPSFRMEGSPITGYEGWLALAQQGSQVVVETARRFVFARNLS